jgi:hypothetical protein
MLQNKDFRSVKHLNQLSYLLWIYFGDFTFSCFTIITYCVFQILSSLKTKQPKVFCDIPKPVWVIGFAIEQPLRIVAIVCSASGILKQIECNIFKIKIVQQQVRNYASQRTDVFWVQFHVVNSDVRFTSQDQKRP